ncbi:MAG: outer membrane lipoprotein carrier protein LolA [Rhodothermales bacterium]
MCNRIAVVLLLVACCMVTGSARAQQSLLSSKAAIGKQETLYGEFLRVLVEGNRSDSLEGSFYYLGQGRIYFEIVHPLNQVLLVHHNVITIYYPDRHRGFILEGKSPAILPLVPAITAAIRPDYGLTNLGFQIYDQNVRGDTLFTFWHHPVGGEELGRFRLAKAGERLSYAVYEPPDTDGAIRTTFEEFKPIGSYIFPSKIRTENVNMAKKAQEILWLKNIRVNPDIPVRVSEFKIPDDAVIEKKKL